MPPWYERYVESTLILPVCSRAIRVACSTASVPALVKKTLVKPSGAISMIKRAASLRTVVGVLGGDRAHPRRLLLDRSHDLWVLVADVDVDELRREVEVAVPLVVPHVDALGTGDRHRLDARLGGPRVKYPGAVVGVDSGAEFGVRNLRRDHRLTRFVGSLG